jgi:ribosomal protein S14
MTRQQQWIKLDQFRRHEFLKAELRKKILKSLVKNTQIPNTVRYYAFYNYTIMSRASSVTQSRNRCVVSGRKWMIVQKARYSRFVFRRESYNGNLPGLSRGSW